ncbi:MAG: hypothetical protein HKP41_04835 [Desulfobacterales bacterium]|nr:hypothetical protein [Desulfobacterales bacterium]
MNQLTLCYSTHRPEILDVTIDIMKEHDVIILEEPPHPQFQSMLAGETDLDDYMLELDLEYPLFSRKYNCLLQDLFSCNIDIIQLEPFLEHLERIHFFFAEDHSPEDIDRPSILYDVYQAERNATSALIEYYKSSRSGNFYDILEAMQRFAKADAQRFKLRDTMRANSIIESITTGRDIFIEVGAIHKYLGHLLDKNLSGWLLNPRFIEEEIIGHLELEGTILNPGDQLTLCYIFGEKISRKRENLLCGQSLIYTKIIHKEEIDDKNRSFPHLRNEISSINLVKSLNLEECRRLFSDISSLSTQQAREAVSNYSANC